MIASTGSKIGSRSSRRSSTDRTPNSTSTAPRSMRTAGSSMRTAPRSISTPRRWPSMAGSSTRSLSYSRQVGQKVRELGQEAFDHRQFFGVQGMARRPAVWAGNEAAPPGDLLLRGNDQFGVGHPVRNIGQQSAVQVVPTGLVATGE